MASVFWIGLSIAGVGLLLGFIGGVRSPTLSIGMGLAVGAFWGVLLGFPLLAIGVSTS
jgi:hypothetical protein